MIIGVAGFYCAGKDSVSNFLLRNGFDHVSLSDLIREDLRKYDKDKEITRDLLIEHGNFLRNKFGPFILSQFAMHKIKSDSRSKCVITSIRNPAEVEFLKKNNDFVLVWVEAKPETRLLRIISRDRENDPKTLKELLAKEKIEMSSNETSQQLHLVRKQANIVVNNNGSIKELEIALTFALEKHFGQQVISLEF